MKRKKIRNSILSTILLVSMGSCMLSPFKVSAAERKSSADKVTPSGISYDEIGTEINQFIEERKVGTASVSIGVFNGEETINETYYGYANVDEKTEVNESTVYEWGSVSKLLVWVSVMQLYEQNKIELDMDVREYLPEDFLTKLSFDTPITMTHLMNHTAGFQEVIYGIEGKSGDEFPSLEDALKQYEPSQIYEPGSVCSYSNWGTSLAAYIVECVSKTPYDEYVKKHIFNPLGMKQTSVLADRSDNEWVQKQRELLYCYAIYEGEREDYGKGTSYCILYPCGAVTGTLKDFISFGQALVPMTGKKCPLFEKEDTLNEMFRATSYYGDSKIPRNCHGMWVLQYQNNVVGHNGNTNCTSTLMIDPTAEIGIVIMTNEAGETAYNFGLLSLLFGEYQTKGNINSEAENKNLSGIYTSARANVEHGFAKIAKYKEALFPITRTEENPNIYRMPIGQGTMTKVADKEYIMDNENGWKYLMYQKERADGTIMLEMMSQDITRENTLLFWLKVTSVVLFFVSAIYGSVMILLGVINAIIRLFRKIEKPFTIVEVVRMINFVAMSLLGCQVFQLIFAEGAWEREKVILQGIIIILLTLFVIINSCVTFMKRKQLIGSRIHKISLKITTILGTYMVLSVIYWEWFYFWAY